MGLSCAGLIVLCAGLAEWVGLFVICVGLAFVSAVMSCVGLSVMSSCCLLFCFRCAVGTVYLLVVVIGITSGVYSLGRLAFGSFGGGGVASMLACMLHVCHSLLHVRSHLLAHIGFLQKPPHHLYFHLALASKL